MDKQEKSKSIATNSERISYENNANATSMAWNDYVMVIVDGTFSMLINCLHCELFLKWKHRDGTNGLKNTPNPLLRMQGEVADAVVLMCATDIR